MSSLFFPCPGSRAFSVLALSCFAALSQAQSLAVDTTTTLDVVQVAAHAERGVDNPATASSAMTVIPAEELKRRPVADLNDILRDIEGFDMGGGRDDSGQARFTLRGLDADYTLILVDGKRQNSSGDIFPNAYRGYEGAFIPPMEMIERVEVIRGPMATIYGADAIGGVINIITKRVSDQWNGSFSHSQSFQQDSTLGASRSDNFSLQGPLLPGTLGLNLRGSHTQDEVSNRRFTPPSHDPKGNPYPYPDSTPPSAFTNRTERSADSVKWSGGGRLSFTPTMSQEFLLDYDLFKQRHDRPDDDEPETAESVWSSSFAGYGAGSQRSEREQYSLTWNGNWDIGRSEVIVSQVKSSNFGRTLPLTLEERIELDKRRKQAQAVPDSEKAKAKEAVLEWINQTLLPRANRAISEEGLVVDAKQELNVANHHTQVGFQVQHRKFNDAVFDALGHGSETFKQWSLFAENDWALTDHLTLTGGARYDKNSRFKGNISPRVYAVWQANSVFTLKGGVGTGYKAPKTNDLYNGIAGFSGGNSGPYAGNPDLKPEKTITSELGAYFNSARGDAFNITVFRTQFRDKIEEVYYGSPQNNCRDNPDGNRACANIDPRWHEGQKWGLRSNYPVRYPNNMSEVESRGVEVSGTLVFSDNWRWRNNYTHSRMRMTKGPLAERNRPISGRPAEHIVNSTLYWQVQPNWELYLNMYAESSRFRGYNSTTNLPQPSYRAYQIFHLGTTWQASETFTVTARINNLLNRDFSTYQLDWSEDPSQPGRYRPSKMDDYRVTDKARSFWLSFNARF